MTWLNLGHINAMSKRANTVRYITIYIFLKFDGSMLTYLLMPAEEEE
jgi:hypothetical protein